MLKFKTIALIGASALSIGAAAAGSTQAQPWNHGPAPSYGPNAGRLNSGYVDGLDWKLTNAARNHVMSWREANDLRDQLHRVQPIAYRVQTGQASGREYRRLDEVVSRIEVALNRYAYNDRRDYDRYRH